MSDDSNDETQDDQKPKALHERWAWVEALFAFFEFIAWAPAAVVRLAAWVFVGLVSSCT